MATPQGSARELAATYAWEVDHQATVTRIALEIYEQLRPLHGLGDDERLLLECAGLVHDIGWVEGQKKHHRRSASMIVEHGIEGLDDRQVLSVAAIARYHRKAMPDLDHEIYRDLDADEQQTVRWCSSILRVADGLDRAHDSAVSSVHLKIDADTIEMAVSCSRACDIDVAGGQRKVSALEAESHRTVRVAKA